MISESFSQKTFINSNTDILLRDVKSYATKNTQAGLLERSNSNLKDCLKKKYNELSKTNPQLSIKSKNLIWKPRTSISAEFCESNYSPIAKRLYSLVNSKNVSPCQFTVTNNNCTPINFIVSNNILTKNDKDKTLNKSTLTENICDINHNKLRGFFKHISVEKSGLSIKPTFNIINKSIKSKPKKINKIKGNGDNTSVQLIKKFSLPLMESTETETNVNFKDVDKFSDDNTIKKKYLEVIDKENQIEFNNDFQNTNMNSSNCTDVKFENPIISNKSICSSPDSPQNTIRSESLEKNNGSEKDLIEQLSDGKVVLEEELSRNKKIDNKLNSYLNKFCRLKNKSENKNKMKTNSFKINIFEKKCESETIVLNDSKLINGKNSVKDSYQFKDSFKTDRKDNEEKLKYSWNSNLILEKLSKPIVVNGLNKGDCEIKSKTAFTKKIFKIFSQSGQISKKNKLIRNSSETINNIAADNLINLITILSAELIMSPTWNKHSKSNDPSNNKMNGKNELNKPACNELIHNKETFSKPFKNSDKNLTMATKSSLHNTSNPSKKMTLTFDFNGRVIKDHKESDPQVRINNYLHHGSLGNLNNLTCKNSSTLSIPIRYGHDNQLFRSQRFPAHSTDRDSINSNNLQQKSVNKFGLFQDHQLNKSRDYKSVYNSQDQDIVHYRKLNSQQTYQFKPLSGNLKNKGKGDYRTSHERLSAKLSAVKPKEIIFKSGKQFEKDSKQSIYDKNCSEDKIEKGNYKFSTQIKSRIDFLMLDEVFELKEELYNNCAKSMIYIRQKNKVNNMNLNTANKHVGECWFLHVESPTSEALKNSLKIVANRFPGWNLQQYIDD